MKFFLSIFAFLITLFFIIYPAQSQLTKLSIDPSTTDVGTEITIGGTSFDPTPGNNLVYFTGAKPVKAESVSSDEKTLSVIVPQGARSGQVIVKVGSKLIGSGKVELQPSSPTQSAWLGVVLAVLARTFIPFFNEKLKSGNSINWNWKFVIPPILAIIGSVPSILILLPAIGYRGEPWQDFLTAFTVTYTSQDLIRELQKGTEPPSQNA